MSTTPFLPSQQPASLLIVLCKCVLRLAKQDCGCTNKELVKEIEAALLAVTAPQSNLRDETIIGAIATIIQTGHIEGKTSHEIACEIVASTPPLNPGAQVIPERDSRDSLAN